MNNTTRNSRHNILLLSVFSGGDLTGSFFRSFLAIFVFSPALAFGVGQGWSDGTSVGNQSLGSTVGNVTMTNANALGSFGSYNQPSTLTNLQNTYGASNTNNVGLFSYGQGKLTNCAGYTPNPNNPASNNECDVVNLLATNPEQHAISASGITKNDPMFTNQNNAYNLGMSSPNQPSNLGSGTTQSSLVGGIGCVQTATTNPSTTTTSTCTKTGTPYPQQCQSTVSVTVTQGSIVPATLTSTGYWVWVLNGMVPISSPSWYPTFSSIPVPGLYVYPANAWWVNPNLGLPCAGFSTGAPPFYGSSYYLDYNNNDSVYCISGSQSYTCPAGYTLSGTNCIGPTTATSSITNNCGTLQSKTAIPAGTPAVGVNGTYQCDAGYTLNGNYCTLTTPNVTSAALVNGTYSCPSGKTLVGGLCY